MERTTDAVSAAARLALWVEDQLEPEEMEVVIRDLDLLYELCVAVERLARSKYPEWS